MTKENPHLFSGIHHRVIHIDVYDVSSSLNLCSRHSQSACPVGCFHKPGELSGTGDIGPFPYVGKTEFAAYVK